MNRLIRGALICGAAFFLPCACSQKLPSTKTLNKMIGESYDAKEHDKAYEYARISAAMGDTTGMYWVGWYNGRDGDYPGTRAEWYTLAAEKGDASAQVSLGELYERGEGFDPHDYIQARFWYEKAAAQGNKDAANALEQLPSADNRWALYNYALHDIFGPDFSLAFVYATKMYHTDEYEAQKYDWLIGNEHKSKVCFPLALYEAMQGDAAAQFFVGDCYDFADYSPVEENFDEALRWYEKSAAQGFAPAQYRLASIYTYYAGWNDEKKAISWLEKAAAQNFAPAQFALAEKYKLGEGVTQDYEKALRLYEAAAKNGEAVAFRMLGHFYATGTAVLQDAEKAASYYAEAEKNRVYRYAAHSDEAVVQQELTYSVHPEFMLTH